MGAHRQSEKFLNVSFNSGIAVAEEQGRIHLSLTAMRSSLGTETIPVLG